MNKRIIAFVLAAAMLLMGASALAERTLTASGTGVVYVDADRVGISLGVREVAADVVEAQSAVNARIASVIAAVRDLGDMVVNVTTSGIGVYTNYSYDSMDGMESVTGYTAYNTIQVLLSDADSAGACIDAAFAAGANSLDYVEFSASDTSEASDRALTLAVESARAKAQVMADAAGVKLGEVLEIRDNADMGYDAGMNFKRMEAEDVAEATQVLASRQQVSASVVVTFAIAD